MAPGVVFTCTGQSCSQDQIGADDAGVSSRFGCVVGFAHPVARGWHRFEAASRLRMPDAPCIIVTEDDLNAELAMIDENLCRTDMTQAERARIMARRKELYEEKHPETKHGAISNGRSRVAKDATLLLSSFGASTAAAIGKVERVVQLDVSRGTKIGEEALALVTRMPLDNARYLDTLKGVPKPEQVEHA